MRLNNFIIIIIIIILGSACNLSFLCDFWFLSGQLLGPWYWPWWVFVVVVAAAQAVPLARFGAGVQAALWHDVGIGFMITNMI